ncbi:Chitin synthase, class 7 [Cladochytrium tenue]|nr:Chitin synthase, class 7 [Cladochytrium tenue]
MTSSVQPANVAFSFGSFDYICSQVALPICPLVGTTLGGVEPTCYSRNIQVAGGMLIFEPGTLAIHIVALIMTAIMIYNIRSKYTAVGRKEIVSFFYMYAVTIILEFLLVSNIVPSASGAFQYITAAYVGMVVATLWCLFFNGFVVFQWIDDGTPKSLWTLRLSSLLVFAISFAVSILTFQNRSPFSSAAPTGLFIVYFIFSAAFIILYVVLQVVLVVNKLDDRWPLGDLFAGLVFFAIGIVFEFVLSARICSLANHYVDGIFFCAFCSLLAVMMVYKFWDSITKDDLEFSVGGRANVWEVKDPLLAEDDRLDDLPLPQEPRRM